MNKQSLSRMLGFFLCLVLFMPYMPAANAEGSNSDPFPEFSPPIELGAPLNSSPTIYDGAAGKEDGVDVLYTTSKSVPAMFNVIDLDNNKLLRSLPLGGAADSWQHEVAPDGTVYIAAGKFLWGYSPVTKQVEALVQIPEASLWALAVDEKSNAYIGTYPSGKVFKYDKQTDVLRDYGKMIGEISQEYVRSMDYHEGFIYAGTAHKKIMKLNVETGEKVDIAGSLDESGFVYDLNVVDGKYLFARYSDSKKMYIYDLEQEKWADIVIPDVNGLHVADSLNNKVYLISGKKLKFVDLTTLEIGETNISYGSGLRGADWVEIEGDERLPGKSLATITFDGKVIFFNIETETMVQYPSVVPPTPNVTNKIMSYSDDSIYISGMTGATGAVLNPKTGEFSKMSLGQADTIHEMDGKVYFGVYPEGSVHVVDPAKNPTGPAEKLFVVGNEQDRLHSMAHGGGNLFIGSIPTYGKLGGALTVYNPGTKTHKVFRNIVPNQSIQGLAYKDGLVYGSTGIYGGLGSTPTEDEAKIFVWDPNTESVLKMASLKLEGLDKPEHIGELKVGPEDGLIWGASKGFVFALDPNSLDVVKSVEVDKVPEQGAWNAIHLEWSETGLLYANIGSKLYVVDPETLQHRFITNTVSYDIGEDGDIYFARLDNRTLVSKIEVIEDGEYSWEEMEVRNPGFEDDFEGWTSMFGTAPDYHYEVSADRPYSGSKSLKILDQTRENSVAVYSEAITVVPGEVYKGTAMMNVASGTPSLLVRMYDKNGKQLHEEYVQVRSGYGEWQKVEVPIRAPKEASVARLFALSTSYAMADAYFDQFGLYERVKPSEVLQKVELEVETTTLTRGNATKFKVIGTKGDGEAVDLKESEIISSDPSVVQVERDSLLANDPGTAKIHAKVVWRGKTVTSNEVEVKVDATFESIKNWIQKQTANEAIPLSLNQQLLNHLHEAEYHYQKGSIDQSSHHLNKMEELIVKLDARESLTVKEQLLNDISYLKGKIQ